MSTSLKPINIAPLCYMLRKLCMCYSGGLCFEGSMEEIEERESELGLGGQEPWWLRQEETMNSNVAGHPRETVSLNPRLKSIIPYG